MIKYLLTLVFLMLSFASHAQNRAFALGKSYLSLGYAPQQIYANNFKSVRTYLSALNLDFQQSSLGPICVNYEKAISWHSALGLRTQYAEYDIHTTLDVGDNFIYSNSSLGLSLSYSYHFGEGVNWDPYLLGSVGYNIPMNENINDVSNYIQKLDIPSRPKYIYNVAAGLRYFYKSWGFFGEFGYSNTHYALVGLNLRFGKDYSKDSSPW